MVPNLVERLDWAGLNWTVEEEAQSKKESKKESLLWISLIPSAHFAESSLY
jgi:hypothetical protein